MSDLIPMTDENSVRVYKHDLEHFIVCAFRYLNSRHNDVLIDAMPQIERYWEHINDGYKRSIRYDLRSRLESGGFEESERKYIEEF